VHGAQLPVAQRRILFSPSRNHNLWTFIFYVWAFIYFLGIHFRSPALGTVDDILGSRLDADDERRTHCINS